jgi:hypothetical protein
VKASKQRRKQLNRDLKMWGEQRAPREHLVVPTYSRRHARPPLMVHAHYRRRRRVAGLVDLCRRRTPREELLPCGHRGVRFRGRWTCPNCPTLLELVLEYRRRRGVWWLVDLIRRRKPVPHLIQKRVPLVERYPNRAARRGNRPGVKRR